DATQPSPPAPPSGGTAPNPVPEAGTPARARPYVLVVDDNPAVSGLLVRVLQGEGYEAAVAEDGKAALRLLAERPPDLVLLDLDLPYLSGEEVCRRLKADPLTRLIPVVIITARDEF